MMMMVMMMKCTNLKHVQQLAAKSNTGDQKPIIIYMYIAIIIGDLVLGYTVLKASSRCKDLLIPRMSEF